MRGRQEGKCKSRNREQAGELLHTHLQEEMSQGNPEISSYSGREQAGRSTVEPAYCARSWRPRLHFSAGGVNMVVRMTMIMTAEKTPSSTMRWPAMLRPRP